MNLNITPNIPILTNKYSVLDKKTYYFIQYRVFIG